MRISMPVLISRMVGRIPLCLHTHLSFNFAVSSSVNFVVAVGGRYTFSFTFAGNFSVNFAGSLSINFTAVFGGRYTLA